MSTKDIPTPPAEARQDALSRTFGEDDTARTADALPGAPGSNGEAADDRSWRGRRGSSAARLISAKARADRTALQRERLEAEQRAMAPLLELVDRLEAGARERGDDLSIARCGILRIAMQRGQHRQVDILLNQLSEAARPKPTADVRDRLIDGVVAMGKEAVDEVVRRFKARGRP